MKFTKKIPWTKIFISLLIALIIFSGGYWTGYRENSKEIITKLTNREHEPKRELKDIDFNLFWETWDLLESNYIDDLPADDVLFYGALSGLVASLDDPHSIFLTPEMTKEFNREMDGEFEGIGAEIGIRKDRVTVISPLPNTPAHKAGLQPQDQIFAIDDEDTTGMLLNEAVSKIRGEKASVVKLTILRKGENEFREIEITRGVITVPSVTWEVKDDNIVYIQIYHFNSDAINGFRKSVLEILPKNPKGVILDLRSNPGGFFGASISVADYWIDEEVIVKEAFADDSEKVYNGSSNSLLKNIPTVVLVNGGSASASEIVSGALQDHKKATIIGEQTFGKGSVQGLNSLSDGSSVKLTAAKWFTPNGSQIDGIGITPDIEIEMTREDYENYLDPQLEKAIEVLKEQIN